jgi:hypothetical protein
MKFFTRNKPPSPGRDAADLSPQGEVKGVLSHLSLWGRGRRAAPGEGAFSSTDCAIWHDIVRALDAAQAVPKRKGRTS